MEALQQRMDRYKAAAAQAKSKGEDRKARMHERIVKVKWLHIVTLDVHLLHHASGCNWEEQVEQNLKFLNVFCFFLLSPYGGIIGSINCTDTATMQDSGQRRSWWKLKQLDAFVNIQCPRSVHNVSVKCAT